LAGGSSRKPAGQFYEALDAIVELDLTDLAGIERPRGYGRDQIVTGGRDELESAIGAAMITPHANTEAMNLHLGEVSTQVTAGAQALLVCDGAGWHQRGRQLGVPDNIAMLTLPAYSPELNPMENVWDYLRQNKLCSRVWDTYEDIVEACKQAWHFLIDDPDRIRSLGKRSWACVNV
jgi:hypothetical protein